MPTIADPRPAVTVGIDTHLDTHVAAVVDHTGQILGTTSVTTTPAGYRRLARWAAGYGPVRAYGIEGTGAYGAGLARHLHAAGHRVVEVNRPDRATRRRKGKSDPVDAEAAARAVLAGTATATPKTRSGQVEAVRALRVARRSAVKARTQAINQLHALVLTAPEPLRTHLRALAGDRLIAHAAALRPAAKPTDPIGATRLALRELARRCQTLTSELTRLDTALAPLVAMAAPTLRAVYGAGPEVTGALLVTAGDNPARLVSEASFAHLTGTAPLPASSGRTTRHRLNRGGDRHANNALWRIVLTRMRYHEPTRRYVARRTGQGLSKKEIIRCLQRYVAREVYRALLTDLPAQPTAP